MAKGVSVSRRPPGAERFGSGWKVNRGSNAVQSNLGTKRCLEGIIEFRSSRLPKNFRQIRRLPCSTGGSCLPKFKKMFFPDIRFSILRTWPKTKTRSFSIINQNDNSLFRIYALSSRADNPETLKTLCGTVRQPVSFNLLPICPYGLALIAPPQGVTDKVD